MYRCGYPPRRPPPSRRTRPDPDGWPHPNAGISRAWLPAHPPAARTASLPRSGPPTGKPSRPNVSLLIAQKIQQRLGLVIAAGHVAVKVEKILHGLEARRLEYFLSLWGEVNKQRRGEGLEAGTQFRFADPLAAGQGETLITFRIDV